jgi:DNA-binding CsgD family transcriptional regulator
MLLGRSIERRRISRLLAAAANGKSGVLLVVGEPGIGKSTLLDHASARTGSWTVLRTRGIEMEAELPFAGLAELLAPITDRLDVLPNPQAAALAGALAIGPPAARDQFTIYVATLSLIAAAAERRPTLVVVDDAQWLDRSSQHALLFAARRVQADRIAFLMALRPEPTSAFSAVDFPRLDLGALDPAVAVLLLRRSTDDPIDETVADRLVLATGGNPLALMEMPRLLSADQLSGVDPLPDPLPLRSDLRQVFLRRIAGLPAATRRGLLVAAANNSGSMAEIGGALSALGLAVSVLEPAESAGIIAIGVDLQFAHPLVRASVYHEATPTSRRNAHRALAEAVGDDSTTRRAWHLAAATIGQDETVARAMEIAADDARLRGAHDVAGATLERAARLSPELDRRLARQLGAAGEYEVAGQSDRALAVLERARETTHDSMARVEIDHLRGRVLLNRGPVSTAEDVLAGAAHSIEAVRPVKAAEMLTDAALACLLAGRVSPAETLSRRAFALTDGRDDQAGEIVHVVFTGVLVYRGRRREAAWHIERQRQRFVQLEAAPHRQILALASIWLIWAEEHALVRSALDAVVEGARSASAPGLLPLPLAVRAELALRTGDWSRAYASCTEAVRLAEETGQRVVLSYALAGLAQTLAGLGREADCRSAAAEATRVAIEVGSESTVTRVEAALGLLDLGTGRSADAAQHLLRANEVANAHGIDEPTVVPFAADLVEALLRAGDVDRANEVLGRLANQAADHGRLWTRAVAARSQGMVAVKEFETHFEHALRLHDRLPAPFERARTQLAYGERLRRAGRRTRSREQMRRALTEFDRLGAASWAARARAELRATGEAGASPRAAGIHQLTPQELQVALAVAAGSTNREAAAALFLSTKTIEFHLGNVYSKLEIRSRTQLARLVLAETSQAVN